MTELLVRVPPETPPDARVFLSGSASALGPWRADGFPLDRRGEQFFGGTIPISDDGHLDYLITLGSWRLVEAHPAGLERGPRRLTASAKMVGISVSDWGRHSVRYHHRFYSENLNNHRTMSVYVPPGYESEPDRRFPVMYMHDGQNLFDAATAFGGVCWEADETCERLVRSGRIEPVILVGIANTQQRIREYGPTGRRARGTSRSFRYGKFIVEELKPFIDRTYRTNPIREHTAIGGSSMGGLISLFLAQWYPDTFGMCMALSPSLWWDRDLFLRLLPADHRRLRETKFWIATGTEEGNSPAGKREQVRRVRRLAMHLESSGLRDGVDYCFRETPGGQHNERNWGRQFESMLEHFFPVRARQRRGWDSNP
jgi:predicted alpha/beta superfamily hydrolase